MLLAQHWWENYSSHGGRRRTCMLLMVEGLCRGAACSRGPRELMWRLWYAAYMVCTLGLETCAVCSPQWL